MDPITPKTETRTYPATELRVVDAVDGKPPRIEGYAAVFNAMSEDLGGFREIVLPGAFKRSLASGADIRLLINHDGLPLARSASRTLQVIEDAKGLRFAADLDPDDPDVRALLPKMRRGDVSQCSFAFMTRSDNWRVQDKQQIRELADVDVSDVSVVTYPAYPQTSAAVRSLAKWRAALPPEQRATMEVEDNSLIYYCRYGLQSVRAAFDACNRVLDCTAAVTGELNDQDMEAAEDMVSALVDLIAKARRTKATLEALGAEDESEDDTADDDQPQEFNPDAAAALALADAD